MNNCYVTMTIAPNGMLVIAPNPSIQEETEFLRSLSKDDALAELLEYYICNGWDWVQPEECGALTDAPMISNDCSRDDNGKIRHLGQMWWHGDYMLESAVDVLLAGNAVIFIKGN